jgi:hypothetical protein
VLSTNRAPGLDHYVELYIMQSVFRLAGAANLAEQRHWSRSAIGSLKIPLN